jgi:hypothetical protein
MEEVRFTRNGNLNTRNQHTWADENSHSFQETRCQQQFAITACPFLGPYELQPRLSGTAYLCRYSSVSITNGLRAG